MPKRIKNSLGSFYLICITLKAYKIASFSKLSSTRHLAAGLIIELLPDAHEEFIWLLSFIYYNLLENLAHIKKKSADFYNEKNSFSADFRIIL
jgi:hypothetical protein